MYNIEDSFFFGVGGEEKINGITISYFWYLKICNLETRLYFVKLEKDTMDGKVTKSRCTWHRVFCNTGFRGSRDLGSRKFPIGETGEVHPEFFTKNFYIGRRLILSMTWWHYGLKAKLLRFHQLICLKGDILYTPVSISKWNSLLLYDWLSQPIQTAFKEVPYLWLG